MQNTIAARYNIRKLPTCGPLHSKSSLTAGGETSRKLTRHELQDACRRHKTQEIAAMASSRKREARSVQNQRATNRGGDTVDAASQMQSLDAGVKLCARKYNEAKSQADKLDDELNSRCDELGELERESKALHEMLEGNNPEAKKITQLSAEIEETNNCSEQILMYRHQLHHMYNRISKNSVTMDGHIGEMSATLASLQKERDRAQKMLAEVESGLTFASLELDDTIRDTNIAEEERNRELTNKQIEANDASRMERWNRQRIDSNLSLHQQLSGGDKSEIEKIHRSIRDRKAQLKELNLSMDKTTARLGEVETSFLHLKQATGVNSLAEMVDKFSCHEDNHKQLLKEKKDAEDRLVAARATVSSDEEAFDQMKANGLGNTELDRDIINGIKSDILDERSEGKIVQSTNARLEALLLGLRQGGMILYNRLRPYHSMLLDVEAPTLGEIDSTNAAQAASDTLDMITFTEKILGKILLNIGGIHRVDTKSDVEKGGDAESPGSNIRIQPKSNADDDDIITVKTAKDDSDPSDEVPSRARLKKNSQHYSSELKRAQLLKNKKSTTKPSAQRHNDSEAPPMTHTKAKDKVDRLSSPLPSRPKPISSRDDPLDRANAFLTELPHVVRATCAITASHITPLHNQPSTHQPYIAISGPPPAAASLDRPIHHIRNDE
eukprot:scaffold1717_cov62-Cyclotella_meneghiniana.AAC.8